MKIKIIDLTVQDIRFPALRNVSTDKDPHYFTAYITLHTNFPELKGYSLIVTLSGNSSSCALVIQAIKHLMINKNLSAITEHLGQFWQQITHAAESNHLGLDANILRLATAAMMNAVWDLWARLDKKPLWRLLVDMSPEEFVHCLDFNGVTDVITQEEALDILRNNASSKAKRIAYLLEKGYPANSASIDWVNYFEEKTVIDELCHNRVMFKQLLQADNSEQIDHCRVSGVNEILMMLLMAAKFNVPVSSHAGGMGLCEYAQHLAIVDYIYISGTLENRIINGADHLYEHFLSPAVIQNGYYPVPLTSGYSIEMKESSLIQYHYPHGHAWDSQ
jgi:L-alanine-DL-glutamate epimerase-like enolase superfamily enzyme